MDFLTQCPATSCARIDGSRGYQVVFETVRSAFLANSARYLCGGNADKFEVVVALQNYLPWTEIEITGNTWRWDREFRRGTVVKTGQPHDNAYFLFIPHVNNERLLRQAVDSIVAPNMNIWIVDSSEAGLDLSADWLAPCTVLRLPYETPFTSMQNEVIKRALDSGAPYLVFMHSDAKVHDKQVIADLISKMGGATGVAFTNYDALACFDMGCVKQIGFWDESYPWYSSDCDYYRRILLQGWTKTDTNLGSRVDHIVSATLKTGDKLRNPVEQNGWHMSHHAHKWAGSCSAEKFERPYGVAAQSSFLSDDQAAASFAVYARALEHFKALSALAPNPEGNVSWGTAPLYCETFLALKAQEPTLQKAPRILEIGFNAGHSSALLAECFPDAEIVSVDLNAHSYVVPAFELVKTFSSVNRTLFKGDSREVLPTLPGVFDLILIDGGHSAPVPGDDLRNCKKLAHENTIVFMDDISDAFAHWDTVTAWNEVIANKSVVELGRRMTANGHLGYTYGKYLF